MSVHWMAATWDYGPEDPYDRLLLLALADSADRQDGHCWPTIETLAGKTCMSERNVSYCLRSLESQGYMRTERKKDRRGSPNHYYLNGEKLHLPLPAPCADKKQRPLPARRAAKTLPAPPALNAPHVVLPANHDSITCTPCSSYKEEPSLTVRTVRKPSATGGSGGESLHGKVRDHIQKKFLEKAKLTCPWNASEGSALSHMLTENPSWTLEDWVRMVDNYFASDKLRTARPRLWIPHIATWAMGPLDKFNSTNGSNGNGNGNGHRKPGILEAIRNSRTVPNFD